MSKQPSTPSEKQLAARLRNWNTYRLRGMWNQVGNSALFTMEEQRELRAIIDGALRRNGALPQEEHERKDDATP